MTQVTDNTTLSLNEWVSRLSKAFAHTDGEDMEADYAPSSDALAQFAIPSVPFGKAEKKRLADRIAMLGIPEAQMTPEVSLAVSALLEKLDDMSRDLSRTKENLVELERLVDVDPVVPIPNRRAFMRRLAWAITMFERYGHPSTILYFDLNDFKAINDQHGHAAGDLAIRHISQLLTHTMRESDFLARIGGDEFAVIMYYAEDEAAQKRGAKIAEKLFRTPLSYNGKQIELSASYGFYCLRPGDDAETALAAADTSMYVDKRRNKSASGLTAAT